MIGQADVMKDLIQTGKSLCLTDGLYGLNAADLTVSINLVLNFQVYRTPTELLVHQKTFIFPVWDLIS